MNTIVTLAAFGLILVLSYADRFDLGGALGMCGPLQECLVQFEQAAVHSKISKLFAQALQNSGTEVGVPKMNKEQFNEFCKLMDNLRKCFDDQHAETQCKNDSYYKAFHLALRICEPPHRQVFADNIECMSNFQDRDSYKQCRNKTTEVIQTKAATGRVDPNEACRVPFTKECGAEVYNSMEEILKPMVEIIPGCKFTATGGETVPHAAITEHKNSTAAVYLSTIALILLALLHCFF